VKRYPCIDNDRGLTLYGEVVDTYGARVCVRESSADPLVHGWLFIEGGGITANDGAAHLTVDQARDIIKALQRFVKDKSE